MNKTQKILLAWAAVLALIGFALRSAVAGMRFSFAFLEGLAVLVVVYLMLDLLEKRKNLRGVRVAKRIYLVLLVAGVVLFSVLEGLILSEAHTDRNGATSCMIVLGAGLYGPDPSPILKSRLDTALFYLNECPDLPVIVTGSQGAGENRSEAEAMREYLMKRGVASGRIYVEPEANSTEENLRYAKALLIQKGIDPGNLAVALVTNEFHLCRAKFLASQNGMHVMGIAAKTPYVWLKINYFVREAFGLAKDILCAG